MSRFGKGLRHEAPSPMTLLASVAVGAFVYPGMAFLTGNELALRSGFPRSRRGSRCGGQLWLIQSGLTLSPAQFLTGSMVAGAASCGLVLLLTHNPAVAIVSGVTIGLLPAMYFARRRARRIRELEQAWPDGLRHIIDALASGLTVKQALVDLAASGPEPLRRAFERFEINDRTAGTVASLEIVKEKLANPVSDRVIDVLIAAHESRGRIGTEVLRRLADATGKDLQVLKEVETARLRQRFQARAILTLPWFALAVLGTASADLRHFYSSPKGHLVALAGGLVSLAGMWLVGRMARRPVEPR